MRLCVVFFQLLEKAITEVHRHRITYIEWSADGRKLFSGDESGLIMMTLVDFENVRRSLDSSGGRKSEEGPLLERIRLEFRLLRCRSLPYCPTGTLGEFSGGFDRYSSIRGRHSGRMSREIRRPSLQEKV